MFIFWIYITGVAAYVLVTSVCDTIMYYYNNKKSWKGYSLSDINIIWECFYTSWVGAWIVIEIFIEHIKLIKNRGDE